MCIYGRQQMDELKGENNMEREITISFKKIDSWNWRVVRNDGLQLSIMSKNSEGCLKTKFKTGAEFWAYNRKHMKEMMEKYLNGETN